MRRLFLYGTLLAAFVATVPLTIVSNSAEAADVFNAWSLKVRDSFVVGADKFTVAPSTGNTTVAGTLAVTGAVTQTRGATFTGAVTCNGAVTLGDAAADNLTSNGIWQGGSPMVFEGSSADAYEATLAIATLTADRTVTIPDAGGSFLLSTAGGADVANAMWGTSNDLTFEGATADDYELILTLADPTADVTCTLPDASGTVILSTGGAADAANAIWGTSNDLTFEGATADDYELTFTVTDPTADRTVTLPDSTGTVIVSTGGAADTANAISGGNDQLVFEGATADANELVLAAADAATDATVTIPGDFTGDVPLVIYESATQVSATNTTADAASIYIPAGRMTAGKTLRFTAAGTISGANAAKTFQLYIEDAAKGAVATQTATTGDYEITCLVHEHTDTANQKITCKLIVAAGADIEFDYDTDTQDFSSDGHIKLQITSAHGSDTVTAEHIMVDYWE